MLVLTTKVNEYVSQNGNDTFVFTVGSNAADQAAQDAEIAEYTTLQGSNLRNSEDGTPLYFTTNIVSIGTQLEVNREGTSFQIVRDNNQLENRKILKELISLGFSPVEALAAIKDGSYTMFV